MSNNLERILNTDLFIDQYKCNEINFLAGGKDHVEFKKKNILRIAISVLYIAEDNDRKIKQWYIWKCKYTIEGIAILLLNLDNINNDHINIYNKITNKLSMKLNLIISWI